MGVALAGRAGKRKENSKIIEGGTTENSRFKLISSFDSTNWTSAFVCILLFSLGHYVILSMIRPKDFLHGVTGRTRGKRGRKQTKGNVNKQPTAPKRKKTAPSLAKKGCDGPRKIDWHGIQKGYPQAARTPRTLRIYGRSPTMARQHSAIHASNADVASLLGPLPSNTFEFPRPYL
ncbi:hypothetical protein MGYG_01810 [Nannizzia gypsea CBS 118893]|uniref:Uncharacterized protein n=1 Tax=Arthroderma gypseum (strain ATCC MYA-4604 / CBS 118893) TaxID=535722 RepID=E5R3J5_ARTGP|nr:hypothetical protein MGYG_01810 [Nannizzia gypsea CBS 118893]EFQ98794.1 hypothetical protein MGYG_01810 [Nannizzia gypsea CBS 118893]